ncbi:hypothetical protein F5X99DRAFT_370917 [Biscogniauxia marginata]|nr:hypothetical protein F5X99DRAFT_370917 [Biscogniauxia marginata]
MPALSTSLLSALIDRDNIANSTDTNSAIGHSLQVVCAWPVSGQYGTGSRVLYYVLVAACVIARKAEWLRNPCLAAALLLPVVAALHGIVLAAVHVDGAVDMDIYGAFQICAIGILAAPVTVRLSRTYFFDPGRNIIFLWTGVILAGLLSLTVEFYRSNPVQCRGDNGNPIVFDQGKFPYGETSCGLTCSTAEGPSSPLRQGATNEIFVVPAPSKLTFNAATLLAAACCIPAILSLIFTWNKILEINWKMRFSSEDEKTNELIEGTNGATTGEMRSVNNVIRMFLSTIEIPVFSAAVLAILIIGEENLFSKQVSYQTEPITSIGQWGPIIGTALAALGSLYLLFARERARSESSTQHHYPTSIRGISLQRDDGSLSRSSGEWPGARHESPSSASGALFSTSSRISQSSPDHKHTDLGNRRKVARALTRISNYLGSAAADRFDDSEFRRGRAVDFPEIPGERQRNDMLSRIKKTYDPPRDADGNATPILRGRPSGSASDAASVISVLAINDTSASAKLVSSLSHHIPRSQSPSAALTKARANTLPSGEPSFKPPDPVPSPSASSGGSQGRPRRDTLEVPLPVHHYAHHYPTRSNAYVTTGPSIVTRHESSPKIVVSTEPDPPSPVHLTAPKPPDPP